MTLIIISTALIAWTAVVAMIMAACANAGRFDREFRGAARSAFRRDASPAARFRGARRQLSL